jgi:hypothetical protein
MSSQIGIGGKADHQFGQGGAQQFVTQAVSAQASHAERREKALVMVGHFKRMQARVHVIELIGICVG